MGDDSLSALMTHGHTVPCQKDPRKGNAVENYHPITCLPLMWKLLTGVIAEEMNDYLEQEKLLPEEQKNADEEHVEQRINYLLIRHTPIKKHTNLSMVWKDYKKEFDFVPHSWINECMELFGIADNVRKYRGYCWRLMVKISVRLM